MLVALLALGLVIRLAALDLPGHDGDISVIARWAEAIAAVGSIRFHETDSSVYPALLYVLWPLGMALDGEVLARAVKGLSIPFDLAIGVLVFRVGVDLAGAGRALAAAALYLFDPGVLIAGPVWGQVDAAGTLAMVAALVALAWRRDALAGGLAVLALMLKPQFGLALPIIAAALVLEPAGLRPLRAMRAVLGGAIAYLLLAAPLALDPLRYARVLSVFGGNQPMTSLNAFNLWGLLVGFDLPDDGYIVIGALLFLGAAVASLMLLRRRRDLAGLLAVAALLVFAFYFLPTRVHERHLFPALALLAPFAVLSVRAVVAYLALSTAFALTLVYALANARSLGLSPAFEVFLVSPTGVWAIGLTLIAATGAWIVILLGIFSITPPGEQAPE